ncbi:MAG: S-layer homology domain-containing protein [Clostridiales bacterium]|jgi:hypothetical protein|nr:S-layer homology domain-containing protein [Eubacteriales bacterium]MDH7566459.1 S-layer homology domain-containing protein [Clostridiales bacterium]
MMKRVKYMIYIAALIAVLIPSPAYAREGDCGYEGGISAEQSAPKTSGKVTFDYQEVCFISGEPVVFKGTLTVTKSMKQGTISSTYTYSLKNADKSATLARTLTFETRLTQKDNGQTIEETFFSKNPTERITIGGTTYTLQSYTYTRSALVDAKPAINYFTGDMRGTKVYQTGSGTVTVKATGRFYGYDQYWGSTEVGLFDYVIESEMKKGNTIDKWGGTASVALSSTNTKELRYVKNEPDQISFEGGYVQTQSSSSVLEYNSSLPEFDSKGIPTDTMLSYKNSLSLESFPSETRLPVPDISQLKGHWAENDIEALYSLEVYKGNEASFDPEQFMTRAEFAAAMSQAARAVPADPSLTVRTTTASSAARGRNQTVVSPFSDVSTQSPYFQGINDAFKRGLISGKGEDSFEPEGNLTVADALTVFVRALGLEGMAPAAGAVTTFRDNDQIPEYARKAAYVAEKIGLVRGDERGYLNPDANLTKARASAMINRFIDYMRSSIKKNYKEIVDYAP